MVQNNSSDDPKIFSITRLNTMVRQRLEGDSELRNIRVEGEVFNLTNHSSGHIYFSLKDSSAVISCTFFRNANQRFRAIRLREGMQLRVRGNISVYTPRGSYQLNVSEIIPAGEGELRLKIEELKKKLQQEGLFAPERKQKLPLLPLTLGVATAPTGAAIRDIIRVARNRFPQINILLAPCLVQGDDAPGSIVEAITALNAPELNVDLIIAGRGGGSFEDLLAFNDEAVVRAFAASRLPIVSAVGHEIDHPLSDLAADIYAPTPSAAVEQSVPVLIDLLERIDDSVLRLKLSLKNNYRTGRERLLSIMRSRVLRNPQCILEAPAHGLDLNWRDFRSAVREQLRGHHSVMENYRMLPLYFKNEVNRFSKRFELIAERLHNFSPLGTLGRGFAVVRNSKQEVIRQSSQVKVGEELEVLLDRGRLNVKVDSSDPNWNN